MKHKISPELRLLIASQQLAGMQAPLHTMSPAQQQHFAELALLQTDELIKQSGCEVGSVMRPTYSFEMPDNPIMGTMHIRQTERATDHPNDHAGH